MVFLVLIGFAEEVDPQAWYKMTGEKGDRGKKEKLAHLERVWDAVDKTGSVEEDIGSSVQDNLAY